MLPAVRVDQAALAFPPVFVGATARLPLTLANAAPVPATLVCDLAAHPEYELLLPRDAWAGAGYDSCPVQRIGPNGEVATLGSKRVSRRYAAAAGRAGREAGCWARRSSSASAHIQLTRHAPTTNNRSVSSMGSRRPHGGGGDGGGHKFIIKLRPSSTLAMALAFRPRAAAPAAFALPLALANAPGGGGEGGGSTLAVPVTAEGVQPRVVLSKGAVDFGACVIGRGGSGGRPSPYAAEVYVRNNTDAEVQVGPRA